MRSISVLGAAALLAVVPAAAFAQSSYRSRRGREGEHDDRREGDPEAVAGHLHAVRVLRPERLLQRLGRAIATTRCPRPARAAPSCEGNVLFDVRQTRLGARLSFDDTAGWTKAKLSALVEVDFQGGYAGAVPTTSIAFYSPAIRLRKAYADAAWGTESKFTLRIGQDDHIVSLLRPVSLAYIANPLFQFAGTLNGRAPMIEARYDLNPKDGIAVNAQVAAVNPQDNAAGDATLSPGAAVDLGAGNRSRVPGLRGARGRGLQDRRQEDGSSSPAGAGCRRTASSAPPPTPTST